MFRNRFSSSSISLPKITLYNFFTLLVVCIGLTACGRSATNPSTVSGAPPAKQVTDNKAYDDGEHVVFFSALPSSLINAEVARSYNIVRSDNRALVNVSVHKKNADGSTSAINADIASRVANLTGQLKPMDLRRIQEQSAVYYIGLVSVSNGETLLFELNIKPKGADKEIPIKFKQSFFNK